ncbi:MAG: 50S ribosomal protein L23 [Weeksellaceae bacterium]
MRINDVIIAPLITEKTTKLTQEKVYSFYVNPNSTKFQITQVIQDLFKVEVENVRVITRKGKAKRAGRRMVTKMLPNKKIAYIRLKKGTIELFPQA